jgi:hypothetical protein
VNHSSRPEDIGLDSRTRIVRDAEAREEERARLREAQSSPHHAPQERIRLWERLYGLPLPNGQHPLLSLIAASTGLTLEQIRAEQRRRGSIPGTYR